MVCILLVMVPTSFSSSFFAYTKFLWHSYDTCLHEGNGTVAVGFSGAEYCCPKWGVGLCPDCKTVWLWKLELYTCHHAYALETPGCTNDKGSVHQQAGDSGWVPLTDNCYICQEALCSRTDVTFQLFLFFLFLYSSFWNSVRVVIFSWLPIRTDFAVIPIGQTTM